MKKFLIPLVSTINVVLAWPSASLAVCGGQSPSACIQNSAQNTAGGSAKGDLFGSGGLFHTIANIIIFIIGAVAVLMIIIAGLRYVLSAGNSDATKGAKDTILYSVVGLIIAILAFAIVNFVVTSVK